jgi:hypothetical protein
MTHSRSACGASPQRFEPGGPAKPDPRLLLGLTVACLSACALLLVEVQAGPLADPTRPPAALMAPGGLAAAALPAQANLEAARALAAAAQAAEPAAPAAPAVVQGVQLSANGAASALVDGRAVKVGDLLDGRAVLAIDAQGLLVKGPHGPERLWLLVGTAKQAAGSITATQSTRYQAAPAAAAEGNANNPAGRNPAADPAATRSATQTPLSLAGKTTP